MKITRLDLDGTGSPLGLVAKILGVEKEIGIPVPIVELAHQLDVSEIQEINTEAFEGCLLTDAAKHVGGILVRAGQTKERRRFTIAHELGHFLIPFHKPTSEKGFVCDKSALRAWGGGAKSSSTKIEAEANLFAAAVLMPKPHLTKLIDARREPDIETVLAIHSAFEVSKEAATRAYVEHNDEVLAAIISRNNEVTSVYANVRFPRLTSRRGDRLPACVRLPDREGSRSNWRSSDSTMWLETQFGVRPPKLFEQSLRQSRGFATTLLWAEIQEDEIDEEENLTSKERMKARLAKRS